MIRLSKSRFVAGIQCPKRLYLQVHSPQLTVLDDAAQAVMEQGQQVGDEARKVFAGGVLVEAGHKELDKAIRATTELLNNSSIPAIFEATFEAKEILVRVDVLERLDAGRFRIHEVKSSTHLKDHYRFDAGVQQYVLRQCGLQLAPACVMHLNRKYFYQGGEYDRRRLFATVELNGDLAVDESEIAQLAFEELEMLHRPAAPDVVAGAQCSKPNECEFYAVCSPPLPADHVTNIPSISSKKITALKEIGVESIHAVAEDFPLSDRQRRACQVVQSGEPWIAPELSAELQALPLPICFMDFETVFPALPRFAGLRPYDHVPFQWSVHRLESAGSTPQHLEFLADGSSDPRREFIESLLRAVEGAQSIVVYNATFEKARLKELATRFPEHDGAIQAIIGRVWDLYPCIRSYAYHPAFGGSYSLKSVLPAFIPELSYKNLEVGHGGEAVLAFETLSVGTLPPEDVTKIREALLEYCGQDTLALLSLYEALRADPRD